jgi:hypothetical protein
MPVEIRCPCGEVFSLDGEAEEAQGLSRSEILARVIKFAMEHKPHLDAKDADGQL